MDQVWAFIQGIAWLPAVIAVLILLVVMYFATKNRYKAAGADEALVVSGSRKGIRIFKSGGTFVNPFHKFNYFSLLVRTVRSGNQEAQTKTHVPVIVEWTAQIRPDTSDDEQLRKAIEGFIGYDSNDVTIALQQTLDGEIRAVVATMTPEAVVQDKETFSNQVTENAKRRMTELGFDLVNLNIAEVSDRNGYFGDLAAEDREAKRQKAATLRAEAEKNIAVQQAEATKVSRSAELDRDLALEEKNREVTLRISAIKAETDTAKANADIAGELQREVRNQELAARKGEVAVIEAQQAQAAAVAQREAELTRAETGKQKRNIDAKADAEKAEIDAAAQAAVASQRAKGEADATAAKAEGDAKAAKAKAQGEAEATALTTEANARKIRDTGLAEAEVAKAKGDAEAAATLAKGQAEAEVQRLMAEALSANDGANLRVSLATIESTTRIQVATALGIAMHEVGTNATIIDMGGNGSGQGGLLGSLLGGIPELAKVLDVKSRALNGEGFNETLSGIANAVTGKTVTKAVSIDPPAVKASSVEETRPTNPVDADAAKPIGDLSLSDLPVENIAVRFGLDPKKAATLAGVADDLLEARLNVRDEGGE